jgi:hypothetical protein
LSVFDPSDASNESENMSQENVGWVIDAMIVNRPANINLQKASETNSFAKLSEKGESTPTS